MALGTVDFWMALGSAIYTRMAPPLGSAFYATYAPQTTLPPYTVYEFITPMDEYTFNTSGIEAEVQVKTISNQIWPTDARQIYNGTVHPYMQDAPLSVTGFRVLRVRRISRIHYIDLDLFWHEGGSYKVVLEAT